ncbi:DNA polymerase [Nonomuraea sp. NPDC050786]|uniref:DNA polymerase n=1 Tax=Nonomuraea sp. NPDC050786 TaxID=3154840 RepID=UPI00340F2E04
MPAQTLKPVTRYLEGRDPARIYAPGTFPHPHLRGVKITCGHDEVRDAVSWLVREPVLGVDIETMGLGVAARYLKCVQVGTKDHAVVFDPRDLAQYAALQTVLNSGAVLVLHNSPFDVPNLFLNGLVTEETVLTKIWDTLIWARMAEPDEKTSKSLAACAQHYLGMAGEDSITKRAKNLGVTKGKYFEVADLDRPAYLEDAATDAVATARLFPVLRQAAYDRQTQGHPFTKYGVRGDDAWALIEKPQRRNRRYLLRSCRGFRWDEEYLDRYRLEQAKVSGAQEAELAKHGIRPGVSQDLTKWLEGQGLVGDDWPRTDTGLLSAAKGHLKKVDHELVRLFLEHKEREKIDRDYLSKVATLSDHDGKIHPEFNVFGASSTGRDSITGLPLQQFDHLARQIILEDSPGAGVVSVDWSQQEAVIGANIAGDHAVVERYEDESLPPEARDVYLIIAEFAKIARKPAKETLLAQMYGQGMLGLAVKLGLIQPSEAVALTNLCRKIHPARAHEPKPLTGRDPRRWKPWEAAESLGIAGYREALDIKAAVWEAMPRTEELIKKLKRIADEYKCIFTWSGRIVPVPSSYYEGEWGVMVHKGPNYTIQGGAADMLDDAIQRMEDAGLGDALMIPMHDELVVHREAAHDVAKIMSGGFERLSWVAGREVKFRTDTEDLGERWGKPE